MMGIAVASQELKLIVPSRVEPMVLPYGQAALNAALEHSAVNEPVLIAGNRQWALAIAYALQANNRQVRYLSGSRRERGRKEDHLKGLKRALELGFSGKLFFKESAATVPPEPHPWVTLGNRYFLLMSEVRRIKHRIINALRVACPEAVGFQNKLWTRGRLELLESCEWDALLNGSVGDSLRRFVPLGKRVEAEGEIRKLVVELRGAEKEKVELQEEIKRLAAGHPVSKLFGEESFSGSLLALFLGWRTWGTARNRPDGFRAVRHFAGLDVSRMDSKGRMRISRSRPNVRTTLFWLLRSRLGKETAAQLGRAPRPKRLERLLLAVWRAGLREEPAKS